MTDKKTSKAKELDEKALDAVQGGLYSTHGAGNEIKKAPVGKRAPKPDGFISFGTETST
jgi:bacteriocin-like protein